MKLEPASARIVVMARKPAMGTVKTRLSPRLDEGARFRLYEAFLSDKIDQVRSVREAKCVVAVAPPDPPESIRPWVGLDVDLVAQEGADLGARLAAIVVAHFRSLRAPLLLVDSDTPTLPVSFFELAIAVLRDGRHDVVLGPAVDGGYYLIGLSAPHVQLFDGIEWSTPRVLAQTIHRARTMRLGVHLLSSWRDVDEPDDVDHLAVELRQLSPSTRGFPARTAAVLASLAPLASVNGPK